MDKFLPLVRSLKNYNKRIFRGDLIAGLTVGIMLIPQGMAYAMIAGLPPIFGLYASTVPLILYALFGTSRQLAVGPVAMVSLLTASSVGLMASSGTELYILLALTLALMVGLIQFFLGVFRLGFMVNFLSHPVISGFTSAAALIIGLSQLKHLLGIEIPRSHHIHQIIVSAFKQFDHINWITFSIGVIGIFLIILLKKLHQAIPGSLIAVMAGILAVSAFHLTGHGVRIVGEIPAGLPDFTISHISLEHIQILIPAALAISIVSFMESIAVAKAIQSRHKNYKVEPNQELIALGLANIGGSFFQSYPVTGGFSRTAVNDQSGAKTGIASIISAILIVLTLLFFTPLFQNLPNAILASIIMVAVFGLIDFAEVRHLWHANRSDFWMLIATFSGTLVLGIEQGIGLGVILSLAVIIFRSTRPHIAVLGQVPGTSFYRNVDRFDEVIERDELLIVRFDAQLYFANTNYFKEQLEAKIQAKGKRLEAVIINAESINNLDSSGIRVITEIIGELKTQNKSLFLAGVKGPVRDAMSRGGLTDKIGKTNFFMSVQEAVDNFDDNSSRQLTPEHQEFILQSEAGQKK